MGGVSVAVAQAMRYAGCPKERQDRTGQNKQELKNRQNKQKQTKPYLQNKQLISACGSRAGQRMQEEGKYML